MSPRFVLGRENVPGVAEVVNRSLKADCTDFIQLYGIKGGGGSGHTTQLRAPHLAYHFKARDLEIPNI